jgi:hypothetical protein
MYNKKWSFPTLYYSILDLALQNLKNLLLHQPIFILNKIAVAFGCIILNLPIKRFISNYKK